MWKKVRYNVKDISSTLSEPKAHAAVIRRMEPYAKRPG